MSEPARKRVPTGVRILDLATDHIRRHGLERTTLVAVARDAQLSHAAIYRYFASKDDLIDAVTGAVTHVAGGGANNPSSGTGPATGMNITYTQDISVSDSGQLFLSSGNAFASNNNQVFKVDLASGQMSVYAGTGPGGFSGDGGPATSAQFATVGAVTVTPAGEVIVAATGVTNGDLLRGVRFLTDSARTHSLVMCTRHNWVRFVDGIHFFARERREEVRLLG